MEQGTRRKNRIVSAERQGAFNVGTVLTGVGFVTILVCFIGFVTAGHDSVSNFGGGANPVAWWIGIFIGMVIAGIGRATRTIAARGVAGSGLVLDPERARTDLEPWARMGGGMLRDAIDESGLPIGQSAPPAEPAAAPVKVRCRQCKALNDEHDKFCSQCAAALQ